MGIVEGDGGVEALFTTFGVVNRADLETVLSTTHLPLEIGMRTLEPQNDGVYLITRRDCLRPSRVLFLDMTLVWPKTQEPRLLPLGKVMLSW